VADNYYIGAVPHLLRIYEKGTDGITHLILQNADKAWHNLAGITSKDNQPGYDAPLPLAIVLLIHKDALASLDAPGDKVAALKQLLDDFGLPFQHMICATWCTIGNIVTFFPMFKQGAVKKFPESAWTATNLNGKCQDHVTYLIVILAKNAQLLSVLPMTPFHLDQKYHFITYVEGFLTLEEKRVSANKQDTLLTAQIPNSVINMWSGDLR
jgi:hypothetical protein